MEDSLAELIKMARKKKGNIPIITIAKQIGISYGVFQKYESGSIKSYPDRQLLMKICKVLDIDYAEAVDVIYQYKKKAPSKADAATLTLPVYAFKDLEKLRCMDDLSNCTPIEHRSCPASLKKCYATVLTQQALLPDSRVGDIVILEPSYFFKNKDWILYKNKDKLQFRAYESNEKSTVLKAVDSTDEVIFLTTALRKEAYGVVRQLIRPYSSL